MASLEMAGSIASILGVAGDVSLLAVQSKGIKRFFRRMRCPIRVLVLGESGNGKTKFINSLIGKIINKEERTKETRSYKFIHPTGRKIRLYDTAGNNSLSYARQEAVNDIPRKKYDGIINIVCNGYSWAEGIDASQVFRNKADKNALPEFEIKQDYLDGNKKREIAQLKEWIGLVDNHSKIKWVLTVVNKADVWSPEMKQVLDFYKSGEYGDTLKKQLGHQIRHYVVPYCSIIVPFGGREMRLSFSEVDKKLLKDYFLQIMGEINKLYDSEE